MSIHPTSIIDPSAKIAKDVQIGPFCTIGEYVQIESGSKIISHAVIKGPTVTVSYTHLTLPTSDLV